MAFREYTSDGGQKRPLFIKEKLQNENGKRGTRVYTSPSAITASMGSMVVSLGGALVVMASEACKTWENFNFTEKLAKKGKLPLQYRLKAYKFSRSWMMKRTSPLDSSHKI